MRTWADGQIGWTAFDNLERRNAVSVDMWSSIPDIVAELVADDSVRIIVLRGEGERTFVSGGDISQFEAQRSSPEAVSRYEDIADRAGRAISECEKPTIAMIMGSVSAEASGSRCLAIYGSRLRTRSFRSRPVVLAWAIGSAR